MTDKRGGSTAPSDGGDLHGTHTEHAEPGAITAGSSTGRVSETASLLQTPPSPGSGENRDYLDDLKRLQAEFDNFRRRTRADQSSAGDRSVARVIEGLLPVLDNFELAIAHGEGGEGVQLVFKDLRAALERLGLEEVPAEGVPFDPNVHEAVESREVEGLSEPLIIEVYRRGYLHKGQLLRPAMVVVGRPVEKGRV